VFSAQTRKVYFYSEPVDQIMRESEFFEPAVIPGFRIRIADLFDQA
jgi:hypothetical protein